MRLFPALGFIVPAFISLVLAASSPPSSFTPAGQPIFSVPPDSHLEQSSHGKFNIVAENGTILHFFEPSPENIKRQSLNVAVDVSASPSFTGNDTLQSFSTTVVVPPLPTTFDSQLLFLTAGVVLVDDDGESVFMSAGLQYGGTNAQGGPYYTPTLLLQDLSSTQFTQISYGNYPVNPGDTLQISATLDNIVPMPGINWYELAISSPTDSQLDISYLARVNASTPVIAMFRVQEEGVNPDAGEYPAGDAVFEDISVNSTTGVADVEWVTSTNATLDSGISVEVQTDGARDGQIVFVFAETSSN
uniref:Uncharacterized protein n=1 Tax=Mycena chlorophos TaxID=658473 RepID=A0ABQ0KUJ4_MYCCL|nr:predicted protein [Mycena chlorophos]